MRQPIYEPHDDPRIDIHRPVNENADSSADEDLESMSRAQLQKVIDDLEEKRRLDIKYSVGDRDRLMRAKAFLETSVDTPINLADLDTDKTLDRLTRRGGQKATEQTSQEAKRNQESSRFTRVMLNLMRGHGKKKE